MNRAALACTAVTALSLLGLAAVVTAGPLNPPAGPIAPTNKTLTEVEPRIAINAVNTPGDADSLFKITQPGSYYLTGNITGEVGKHGIEIVARGVTLDLNGFDLMGVLAMGAFDGVIATAAGLSNIAVVNGSVRNWGRDGVNLGDASVNACRIEGVQTSFNARFGVFAGPRSQVSNYSGLGSQYGLYALDGSTLLNCSATGNSIVGLLADSGSTLSNCSASNNTGTGIVARSGSTLSNCSSYSNTGIGIVAHTGSTLSNCLVQSNTANGISAEDGSTLIGCAAYGNGGDGIGVGGGSTVERCSVRGNTLDGIQCSFACTIRGNTCSNNGSGAGDGANIHASFSDNRIEGNNCTGADRGVDVDGSGNIIIKNTCSGNTVNWDVAAGNIILVVNGAPAGAVLGDTGGIAPGSTDPNANFTY